MVARGKANPEKYLFRDLHPNILIGTASDRYAGWIGQICSPDGDLEERLKNANIYCELAHKPGNIPPEQI